MNDQQRKQVHDLNQTPLGRQARKSLESLELDPDPTTLYALQLIVETVDRTSRDKLPKLVAEHRVLLGNQAAAAQAGDPIRELNRIVPRDPSVSLNLAANRLAKEQHPEALGLILAENLLFSLAESNPGLLKVTEG